MGQQKKAMTVAGWVIAALIAAGMFGSAGVKVSGAEAVVEDFVNKFGYPQDVLQTLAVVEIACVVIYLIPQTAVLGAILLTGYLGGAVATHVRVHDNFLGPLIGGVLVWVGLYLRDPRIRALAPLRQPLPPNV